MGKTEKSIVNSDADSGHTDRFNRRTDQPGLNAGKAAARRSNPEKRKKVGAGPVKTAAGKTAEGRQAAKQAEKKKALEKRQRGGKIPLKTAAGKTAEGGTAAKQAPKQNAPAEEAVDIKSMYPEELARFVKERGLPAFRAKQLFQWIHASRAAGYGEMTNLPARLRQELAEQFPLVTAEQVECQVSGVDGTRKYLFSMPDGCLVESVFMRYHFGNSVCISSQVGCRMGCSFCASTLHGLVRSLSASEMLEQIYAIARDTGERISHVVVMGMGEPFDNYDNLIRFLRLLTCPEGMNLSQRGVTVSTCGIVPGIRRFAKEGMHITLALSLHASTDEQRRRIMPVANRWSIPELMDACAEYSRATGRQVTFEYSLIRGVNDSREDALGLISLARPLKAHINLIPVNPVRERGFRHPDQAGVKAFKMELENHGVNVSIRRALGKDIEGACGQLRNRYAEQND